MTPAAKQHPVIFIHGRWMHATGWQPWLDLFEEQGWWNDVADAVLRWLAAKGF